MIIVIHRVETDIILMRRGMARYILKLVTTLLNVLYDIALAYNLPDPFIKQNADKSHNGVVGSSGKNIPAKPIIKDSIPMIDQNKFIYQRAVYSFVKWKPLSNSSAERRFFPASWSDNILSNPPSQAICIFRLPSVIIVP